MKDADFEKIVEQHYEDIYRFIFLMLKDKNDAEDITQDTFLKVQRHLKSFEGRSSVKTWLYRIAANEVKRFFKKKETAKHIKVPVSKEINTENERFENLRMAMQKIDKESYEILYLKFFKNMKEKEIAFILNIPEGTVKSRLHAAKEKLKKEMQDG